MYSNKIFNKSFVLLFLSNFAVFIGFEMLLPVMPAYLSTMHASTIEIGLVTSLFTIGSIFIRPWVGHLLLTRNKKYIAIAITLGLLGVTLLYPVLSVIWMLLVLRFFHGIFWGASTTVNNTMAVDYLPKHKLGEGIGYFSISTTVGAIIAQSLGIFIYDQFNFSVVIITAGILNAVACFCLLPTEKVQLQHNKGVKFQYWKSIFLKDIMFQSVLAILTTVSFGAIVTFLLIYGEEKHIQNIFLFFIANAIMSTVLRPITGKWYDKHGPWLIIIASCILGFLSMVILALTTDVWMLLLAAVLFGAGYGTIMPCIQTWAVQSVPTHKTSLANASFFSSFDIGFGVSALTLSLLAQWFSLETVFVLAGTTFLIVGIMVWTDYMKKVKYQ